MHTAPSTRSPLRVSSLMHAYPLTIALWSIAIMLMILATIVERPELSTKIGRWSLLTALFAVMMSTSLLARIAVQRLTRTIAVFSGGVPLDECPELYDADLRPPKVPAPRRASDVPRMDDL